MLTSNNTIPINCAISLTAKIKAKCNKYTEM